MNFALIQTANIVLSVFSLSENLNPFLQGFSTFLTSWPKILETQLIVVAQCV